MHVLKYILDEMNINKNVKDTPKRSYSICRLKLMMYVVDLSTNESSHLA